MKHDSAAPKSSSPKRILFSSVFGPYACDDEYGSRNLNPMELYHNQVTRMQGPFSLRMFHRSFGLMMIEANIDAACTVLDFPSCERFVEELKNSACDIVGISAIAPNLGKVQKMCELVRRNCPAALIIVGGHIANLPGLEDRIDADHIVRGDGVRWFRRYLGQDEKAPVKHPLAYSGFGTRTLGISLNERPGDTAAIVVPSVGCPLGCNFCATSAQFGGKGNFVNFYETGRELFTVLCDLEARLGVRSFFVLDENFLLHKKRALQLLELIEQHRKSWSFYVFSSARVLKSYAIEQLVSFGISWVWMGVEGQKSRYDKLNGVDTRALVRELHAHGICVLGSTIIGLEDHTTEGIDPVIDYAVGHETDFHQFMLYTPVPGTPLYAQYHREGKLLSETEVPLADAHGQYRFNYRHDHIPAGTETDLLQKAFCRDFEVNGPSLSRMFRSRLQGWQRYKAHPDQRVRSRYAWECASLKGALAGALWAMRRWYRQDAARHRKLSATLREIYHEFGWKTRVVAPLLGRLIYFTASREQRRIERGWTYEPETICEKNPQARAFCEESKKGRRSLAVRVRRLAEGVVRTAALLPARGSYVCVPRSVNSLLLRAEELVGKGVLSIQRRDFPGSSLPVIVDLQGTFNRITSRKLNKKIKGYLRHCESRLAINFSDLKDIEHKALLKFFKNLRCYKKRITLINLDSFNTEMADALDYARRYFEVLGDGDVLDGCPAG